MVLLTFCVTCLTTKTKSVPARSNSENQASQADRRAGTIWCNIEIRHLPLCPAERRFSTSQPPGSLIYFSMSDRLFSRDAQDQTVRVLRVDEELSSLGLCWGCWFIALSRISCEASLPNLCVENCLNFRPAGLVVVWVSNARPEHLC